MRKFILAMLLMTCLPISNSAQTRSTNRLAEPDVKGRGPAISAPEMNAVIQAIEDEIYDYGYQGKFIDIGEPTNKGTRVPVYFRPHLENYYEGWVIYKLLPYGEVIRSFYIDADGTAILEGDPTFGFPASEPDHLTIYLDDDQVSRLRSAWSKRYFRVTFLPSSERFNEAAERQRKRVGFSAQDGAGTLAGQDAPDKKLPLGCLGDDTTAIRFFYNTGDYFHYPLIYRAVPQGDARLNTAPMGSEGRTAYISKTELEQLVQELAEAPLSWQESEHVEALGSYKKIENSTDTMEILVVCSKGTARAKFEPKKICDTLTPLDPALKTPRALWEFQGFRFNYGCQVPEFVVGAYPDH